MIANEQLKFNLNAVVDNVNLMNICHKPQPILIQKNSRSVHFTRSGDADRNVNNFNHLKSSFEYIDEEKLSMYSFLVKRDLKNKEWRDKANQENYQQPEKLNESLASVKSVRSVRDPPKPQIKVAKKASTSLAHSERSNVVTSVKSLERPKSVPNLSEGKSEVSEIQKCCDESVRSIEHLQKQLNEFQHERLKVVFNDPQEEEKQKRIQMEQIKYLSRSMYNHQNQMSRFKVQFAKELVQPKQPSPANSVLKRIVHTMRQVVKTSQVFAESYPYRPDEGQITEKLCAHFYKQLQLSVENFSECIYELTRNNINSGIDTSSINRLTNLITDCNKYFIDNVPVKEAVTKNDPEIEKTRPQQTNVLKVVRIRRQNGLSKGLVQDKPIVKKKTTTSSVIKKPAINKPIYRKPIHAKINRAQVKNVEEKKQGMAFEISLSPSRKEGFEKKTVKTAKLFPSKHIAKASSHSRSQSAERDQPVLLKRPSFDEYSINDSLNISNLNRSLDRVDFSPAFKQFSSPTLASIRKMGYNPRSRSVEKLTQNTPQIHQRSHSNSSLLNRSYNNRSLNASIMTPARYENFQNSLSRENMRRSLSDIRGRYGRSNSPEKPFVFDFNASVEKPSYMKRVHFGRNGEQRSRSVSPNKRSYPQSTMSLLSRLDTIKMESDLIRRKYEKLTYEETLMDKSSNNGYRRPYEECYLADAATIAENYESKVKYEDMFIKLNRPTDHQLKRVLDYANKFADYSQKTSVTTIGDSQFDDFELFEYISNELFDEYFGSIYDELEHINDELAANMIDNEFVTDSAYHNNSSSESP